MSKYADGNRMMLQVDLPEDIDQGWTITSGDLKAKGDTLREAMGAFEEQMVMSYVQSGPSGVHVRYVEFKRRENDDE